MGNPILVINPTIVTRVQATVNDIKVGDLVVDRRSTAKDWKKKLGKVVQVNHPQTWQCRMDVRMANGSMKWDVSAYRYQPLAVYKDKMAKNIQRQHDILQRLYEKSQEVAQGEAAAKDHFERLGV